MNIINKKLLALFLTSASIFSVAAQDLNTGYFNDNYQMRWQMNPAMGNRNGYVGFPLLGNLNGNVNGNLNATDVIYNYGGKTVLFTNPNISAQEALGNIHDTNRFSQSANINIIQFGFKAFGGYNNFAVNIKNSASFDLPKSIFSLLKEGLSNQTYDIKDLRVNAKAYAEIALNHSRAIKQVPGLRAGLSLKVLIPVAMAEANFNELQLELGENSWNARSNAEMKLAFKGLKYETDVNDRTGNKYVSGVNTDDIEFGLNGLGFAFDLGALYEWKDFTFSLALTDLGLIKYNSIQLASTNGTKSFETAANPIGIGDDGESLDGFIDSLSPLYELSDMGDMGSTSIGLEGKLRVGVDYKLPVYKKLHFGIMNTTNLSSVFPMTEFRLSANIEPIKGIAASVSAAAGTYGTNYGFLLSLGNKGFNLNLGMDYANIKMDKNHIPLTSNADYHMGITFPF